MCVHVYKFENEETSAGTLTMKRVKKETVSTQFVSWRHEARSIVMVVF